MQALFAKSPEPWAELVPQAKFEERKVVLFRGCVGHYARRDWAAKAERLMDGMGLIRAESGNSVVVVLLMGVPDCWIGNQGQGRRISKYGKMRAVRY